MKTSNLISSALDRAVARVKCGYRISPSPSRALPWEAYWPVSPDEDLLYFATEREAKEWILKKARAQKRN